MTSKLKLYPHEAARLEALRAGHGNRKGSGIFPGTLNGPKIIKEDLLEVKRLDSLVWTNKKIREKIGLSEYVVRMAIRGHYDYIL